MVGVSSGAAGAVAAQRAVNVGRKVVGEVGDFEAAFQAGLSPQDTPVDKRGHSCQCLDSKLREGQNSAADSGDSH